LSDELVSGNEAEEDSKRVEARVDEVEDVEGNIPTAAQVAEKEAKDTAEWFQCK
jgi:hypothetical protein